MAVTIRRFEERDAAAVSRLVQHTMAISNSADYTPERLQPLIAYFTPAKIAMLADERYCLVAVDGDTIVGTAALDGVELVTFFVDPARQGHGIGKALLAALEAHARSNGVYALQVDASITGAAFYERNGYVRTGAELQGTAGTQISMIKELT